MAISLQSAVMSIRSKQTCMEQHSQADETHSNRSASSHLSQVTGNLRISAPKTENTDIVSSRPSSPFSPSVCISLPSNNLDSDSLFNLVASSHSSSVVGNHQPSGAIISHALKAAPSSPSMAIVRSPPRITQKTTAELRGRPTMVTRGAAKRAAASRGIEIQKKKKPRRSYAPEFVTGSDLRKSFDILSQQEGDLRKAKDEQERLEDAEHARQEKERRDREMRHRLQLEVARQQELEAERLRQQELEAERFMAERQRQRELEAERRRQRELEAERRRQRELEAERRRQQELEAERQRQRDLEAERQRQQELEAERQRQRELEAERQRQAEQEADRQRQQESERQRQAEQEAERQKQQKLEVEKQKKRQNELETARTQMINQYTQALSTLQNQLGIVTQNRSHVFERLNALHQKSLDMPTGLCPQETQDYHQLQQALATMDAQAQQLHQQRAQYNGAVQTIKSKSLEEFGCFIDQQKSATVANHSAQNSLQGSILSVREKALKALMHILNGSLLASQVIEKALFNEFQSSVWDSKFEFLTPMDAKELQYFSEAKSARIPPPWIGPYDNEYAASVNRLIWLLDVDRPLRMEVLGGRFNLRVLLSMCDRKAQMPAAPSLKVSSRNLLIQSSSSIPPGIQLGCAPNPSNSTVQESGAPSASSEEPDVCCICLDAPKTHALIPCGHKCSCKDCSKYLKKCPICRRRVTKAFQIFDV
eukprot:174953_1